MTLTDCDTGILAVYRYAIRTEIGEQQKKKLENNKNKTCSHTIWPSSFFGYGSRPKYFGRKSDVTCDIQQKTNSRMFRGIFLAYTDTEREIPK